jgi:acyl carrier protein
MDAVEIVMDVEDHFGITIQDAEANQIRTVGDLVALVHTRIAAAHRDVCPAIPAFLALRQVVRGAVGDASLRIRPSQRVASVLSSSQRRVLWKQLSEVMGSPPSGLRRPKLLRRLLVAMSCAVLLAALFSAWPINIALWPLTMFVGVGVIALLHFVTVPMRSVPPEGWTTFGEITARIIGLHAATKRIDRCSPEAVLDELRPLLIQTLGVDATDIVPSARFVEDLGMS